MGSQLGYDTFCCFLWELDSTDKKNQYIKKEWPNGESHTPEQKNILTNSTNLQKEQIKY